MEFRDHIFGTESQLQTKSVEQQDKEVRSVFLCLLVSLLGDYEQFVTVLRFHPQPSFAFNKEAYLQSHFSEDTHSLLHKIVDGISFHTFIHSRSIPYRKCDFFDELIARYIEHPQDYVPELMYSQRHIEDLAEELIQSLPPTAAKESEFMTRGLTQHDIDLPFKVFPQLKEKKVEQAMQLLSSESEEQRGDGEGEDKEQELHNIPFLEVSHSKANEITSPNFKRDQETLRNCLDNIFQSKIIEARKYIPMVTLALKQRSLVHSLVSELVHRLMEVNSVLLSSDQFDILVNIINSAITDGRSAVALLPVSTIMYRELNPKVHQHLCTYLQHHTVWKKLDFWKTALYSAVQAELVRIYSEMDFSPKRKSPSKSTQRVTTTGVRSRPEEQNTIELSDPLEPQFGEITLRSRQRLRSSDPANVKALRRATVSQSMRMRMRASVMLPGVSEGVLPPNAEPVTSQEALHHLAKQLKKWPTRSDDEQTQLTLQEENAVHNQLILFVQRILQLRVPVEFSGYEEKEALKAELLDFVSRFLSLVELELKFDLNRHGRIQDQIEDLIQIQIDSLKELRQELKRRPLSKAKPKVIKPPLLDGEKMVVEGLHCYLLTDGRENGILVPADGHIFVTTYRVVFLGVPCNPQAPNVVVTRSFPVSSIFRIKKLQPQPITQLNLLTTTGLQIRTMTGELLRIGFDDDPNQHDVKTLIPHIIDLRYPTRITRGLQLDQPLPPPVTDESVCGSMTASQLISNTTRIKNTKNRGFEQSNILGSSDTLTRVKQISDLSRSPCCQQYERMSLGSLNFSASNRGPWKITALNMTYAVCNSYPAVLVVPESASDDTLISVASQFQHNRFPVVTWKHPTRQAVLLRSGSFLPSSSSPKIGPLSNIQNTVLQGKQKFMGVGGKFGVVNKDKGAPQGNIGGTGVFNIDVGGYIRGIINLSQNYRRKQQKSNLLQEISCAPEMMHFDPVHTPRHQAHRNGNKTKSWDLDDVDFSPQRRPRVATDSDRSLTPEPQIDRLYSSPEHIKKGKRRFTISNIIQKAKSPHFNRRKQYRVVTTSELLASPVRGHSQISTEREGPEGLKKMKTMTLPLEGREGGREMGVREDGGLEGEGEGGEREERRELSASSERDSLDLPTSIFKELELEELKALSPTRGIPKTYSLKRGASFPERSNLEVGQDEIDIDDITMTERPETSVSPKPDDQRIDWEAMDGTVGEVGQEEPQVESRPSTSTPDLPTSPNVRGGRLQSHDSSSGVWASPRKSHLTQFGSPDFESSPATFSILPTNPRDWITVDALPSQINQWNDSALYIIGDKAALRDVHDGLYPNCTFVPVEVPTPSDVNQSFKKLMRACSPSTAGTTSYLPAVEESGWINQLSTMMEVAVAVADLIHIQDSSVLVCLENGWDSTAQVVSLAQVLLDPYYRTIEGFEALIEKDWLSFGHMFSQNGNHTTSSNISGFTPIFLQFLDLVHQVMKQFPLSFEFSDFYLCLMAYHHCSMRFHTFTMNTEKERYANNWLSYRPRHASVHGSSGQAEPHASFWDYVQSLHSKKTILYNFKYKPEKQTDHLCPHSYQANLTIWSFYLDNHLTHFPPYDTEFMFEGDLTKVELHYKFFDKEKSLAGQKNITMVETCTSGIGTLLLEYTALMNIHAQTKSLPSASWKELWEELQDSVDTSFPTLPVQPSDHILLSYGQTLHKRTTVAVLIKGKLAVEMEDHFTYPHNFEPVSLTAAHECEFCKHKVTAKNAYKCRSCGSICHDHCKTEVPYNCGHKHEIRQKKRTTHYPDPTHITQVIPSPTHPIPTPQRDVAAMDGLLYKRGKIVRNWKSRYFVLDPEKRELSYYDSKQKERCHGTIPLTDEDTVEPADPQIVPALKSGETGFFFNLITPKRVYNLMAKSNTERAEWMVRIKNALPITTV